MPGRKLNVPRIKRIVMLLSGIVLGTWSGLSGLSAQAAASPYLTFMLGYATPKASAVAFLFGMWASLCAVASWVAAGAGRPDFALSVSMAAGATIGAIVAARLSLGTRSLAVRLGRTAVTFALLYTVSDGIRGRFGGPANLALWLPEGVLGWLAVGAICGWLARSLTLPTGVFLVPALVYAAAVPPHEAVISSLAIAALAGLLPAVGYLIRMERDEVIGPAFGIGGALGGALGGYSAARLTVPQSTWPLVVFGVTAMLLCSWLVYRGSD